MKCPKPLTLRAGHCNSDTHERATQYHENPDRLGEFRFIVVVSVQAAYQDSRRYQQLDGIEHAAL